MGGSETVTLLESEIPNHSHAMRAAPALVAADSNIVQGNSMGKSSQGNAYIPFDAGNVVQMAPQALAPAGGSLPHNNMMPYLTLNFCIALQGVFPPRS